MILPYHPDAEIAAECHTQAAEAEAIDVAAGYPPRAWRCGCGAEHSRGHFLTIGQHRCLSCGYVGTGGTLGEPKLCPNCDAQGYVDDKDGNHECPMCEGDGVVPADFDPVAAGWRHG